MRDHALRHRFDHHNGSIDAEKGISGLLNEFDRARTVEKGKIQSFIIE